MTQRCMINDAKVYDKIMTNGDTASLQGDIDRLLQWSHTWNLPFNEEKCKSMRIGKTSNTISYYMNEHELETIEEEKDLGIIIDNKLKFHTRTSAAIKKANRILGLIKRSFTELDEITLPILYCSMVRPHLEYGNIIDLHYNNAIIEVLILRGYMVYGVI